MHVGCYDDAWDVSTIGLT